MSISSPTRCSLLAGSAFGNAIGATRLASAALAETPVGAKASGIQAFTTHFPASDLVDLRHRIAATSWPERKTVVDDSQGVQIATAAPKSAPRFGRYPARREEGARQLWEPGGISSRRRPPLPAERVGQVRIMLLASFADVGILQASTQVDPSQKRKTSMPTMLEEAAIRGPMIFLRYWTRQILVSFRRHPRIPENLAGEA